jgi:hypothetical protein
VENYALRAFWGKVRRTTGANRVDESGFIRGNVCPSQFLLPFVLSRMMAYETVSPFPARNIFFAFIARFAVNLKA